MCVVNDCGETLYCAKDMQGVDGYVERSNVVPGGVSISDLDGGENGMIGRVVVPGRFILLLLSVGGRGQVTVTVIRPARGFFWEQEMGKKSNMAVRVPATGDSIVVAGVCGVAVAAKSGGYVLKDAGQMRVGEVM